MQLTTEKTVREIAIETPASIRVFESLGIDYCCGGKRSLQAACSHASLEIDRVLDLLEQAERDSQVPDSADWNGQPLSALIGHIIGKHHAFVRQEIPRIDSLLSKVAGKHGLLHPELIRIQQIFAALGQELSTHLMKEEQILFPYMEGMERTGSGPLPSACFGSVQRPIANMLAEHDDAGALLSKIRELTHGFALPAGACPTFVALYRGLEDFERDLHRHVHLENNILFPRALALEEAR